MQSYTMIKDRKTHVIKISFPTKSTYRFNVISIKIAVHKLVNLLTYLVNLKKLILKFIWKSKDFKNSNTNVEEK